MRLEFRPCDWMHWTTKYKFFPQFRPRELSGQDNLPDVPVAVKNAVRQLFDRVDLNGNGVLEPQELLHWQQRLYGEMFDEEMARNAMAQFMLADDNQNKVLEFSEVLDKMWKDLKNAGLSDNVDKCVEIIQKLDPDYDIVTF